MFIPDTIRFGIYWVYHHTSYHHYYRANTIPPAHGFITGPPPPFYHHIATTIHGSYGADYVVTHFAITFCSPPITILVPSPHSHIPHHTVTFCSLIHVTIWVHDYRWCVRSSPPIPAGFIHSTTTPPHSTTRSTLATTFFTTTTVHCSPHRLPFVTVTVTILPPLIPVTFSCHRLPRLLPPVHTVTWVYYRCSCIHTPPHHSGLFYVDWWWPRLPLLLISFWVTTLRSTMEFSVTFYLPLLHCHCSYWAMRCSFCHITYHIPFTHHYSHHSCDSFILHSPILLMPIWSRAVTPFHFIQVTTFIPTPPFILHGWFTFLITFSTFAFAFIHLRWLRYYTFTFTIWDSFFCSITTYSEFYTFYTTTFIPHLVAIQYHLTILQCHSFRLGGHLPHSSHEFRYCVPFYRFTVTVTFTTVLPPPMGRLPFTTATVLPPWCLGAVYTDFGVPRSCPPYRVPISVLHHSDSTDWVPGTTFLPITLRSRFYRYRCLGAHPPFVRSALPPLPFCAPLLHAFCTLLRFALPTLHGGDLRFCSTGVVYHVTYYTTRSYLMLLPTTILPACCLRWTHTCTCVHTPPHPFYLGWLPPLPPLLPATTFTAQHTCREACSVIATCIPTTMPGYDCTILPSGGISFLPGVDSTNFTGLGTFTLLHTTLPPPHHRWVGSAVPAFRYTLVH